MAQPAPRDILDSKLDRLTLAQQYEVLGYVDALLAQQSAPPRGTPATVLNEFRGTMSKEEGEELKRIIEEGCEQVDEDEW